MKKRFGITLVAVLMVLFGLSEIVTGFTHNFLGFISTANVELATYGAAGVGALYALGGFLLLTKKRWAANVALVCLMLVIFGRVALVADGLYPVNTFLQTLSITVGTSIAVLFTIYVWVERRSFR